MAESLNYQCPACSGPLKFSGATQMLVCEYCGNSYTVSQVEELYAAKRAQAARSDAAYDAAEAVGREAAQQGAAHEQAAAQDPLHEFLNRAPWVEAENGDMQLFTCSSCGAQLMVEPTTAVTECPYCGSEAVMPEKLSGVARPDFVIPFKKTKEQAIAALKEHYATKRFLPDAFLEESHLEHIQGVYVPFWLYDVDAHFDARFKATSTNVYVLGREQITETSHFDIERAGTAHFKRIPADGSTKMPDAHMDAIEPYDYSELVPFAMSYLPGYVTERYDLSANKLVARALERVDGSLPGLATETIDGHYETLAPAGLSSEHELAHVAYALMPVWMLHTSWNGEDYLFAMNGQTGRLIGDLPVDRAKVRKFRLVRGAVTAALVFALVFCGLAFM